MLPRLYSLLGAIAVLLPAASVVLGAPLVEPTVIRSDNAVWSATLTVQPARYSDVNVAFTGRQYCYQGVCSYPGPTIEVKPGDTFSLTLVNSLGPESGAMQHNLMHWPNTTNVHTHGLHISQLVDSVFIQVGPGESHTYVYQIPSDHMAGAHWFHAHMHGSSTMVVMGGQQGMLFVAPAAAANIPAKYTAMTKHRLMLSHIQFAQSLANGVVSQGCANGAGCTPWQGCAANTVNSPFSPFRSYSYLELQPETGDTMDASVTYAAGTNASFVNEYVVNGQFQPTIAIQTGEYRVLQIVHAGGAFNMDFGLDQGGGPSSASSNCAFSILAIDGVFLSSTPQVRTSIKMNQAGRWEVQVVCSNPGTYAFVGRFGQPPTPQTLFSLVVSGAPASTNNVAITGADLAQIVRPGYLADLSAAQAPAHFSMHFSQGGRPLEPCGFWLGSGTDCSPIWSGANPSSVIEGNTCPFQPWPGSQGGNGTDRFNASGTWTYKHVTAINQLNEWSVYGLGNDAHPMHIHVNHFQVIAFTPTLNSGQDYRDYYTLGEWRDTLPALNGKVTIRFRAADFPGETITHCHFLRHEDLGMMSSFYVCDPTVPGACPSGMDTSPGSLTGGNTTSSSSSSTGGGSTTTTSSTAAGGATSTGSGSGAAATGSSSGAATGSTPGATTSSSTASNMDFNGSAASRSSSAASLIAAMVLGALLAW